MSRAWVIGLFLAMAAAAGLASWYWSGRPAAVPKAPPEVAIDDPDFAAAVEAARAEVVAHPADASAWGRLGETLLANGRPDAARECLAEAGRLDPKDVRWPYFEGVSLLNRDPTAALGCWERAAACPGDDERARTARLRWAEALLEADRPADAEPVLRAVLAAEPQNPRAHLALGLLLANRGDTAAAIEHLRQCADHPAARKKAAARLAALYALQGKPTEAAAAARKAEQFPADATWPDPIHQELLPLTVGRDGLFAQAELLQQQGDPRQAAFLYQQLLRRYPTETRAYVKLGMLLAEAGEYAEAEGVLRDGLRIAPDLVQAHYFLAVSQFHQAERAGLATPAGQARLREAADEARRATEIKPDHGFAYLYLGLALKGLGRTPEAVAALRTAARCTPESVDPHLHLGQALWETGAAAEGITELETAARLAGPSDPRPKAALERTRTTVPGAKKP